VGDIFGSMSLSHSAAATIRSAFSVLTSVVSPGKAPQESILWGRGARGGGQVASAHSAATSSRHSPRVDALLPPPDALSLFLVLRSTAVTLFRGTGSLQYGSSQHDTHTCTTKEGKMG